MDREELIAQIEQFLLPELQPGYDRANRMLQLDDEDLYAALLRGDPPGLRPTKPPPDEIQKILATYRRILRDEQGTRREWRNKTARKFLVYVRRVRARRSSTGDLTLAEYLEAKLWRLRRDTERSLKSCDRHQAGTGNSTFQKLDVIKRHKIARLLELLAVLDTDARLDEDAVRAIAEQAKLIDEEARLAFATVAGFPPHIKQLMNAAKDEDTV